MTSHDFDFDGQRLQARPSGTLFWPARRWLIVSDLHLGKSERIARRGGQLLPPYEAIETLDRLAAEVSATEPVAIISLGDAFDDEQAALSPPDDICRRIAVMAVDREWIWVGGNHDPGPVSPRLPGIEVPELADALTFRHQAGQGPDISGHYHPCIRLAGQRRRCFLIGTDHLILPAFGAYTGGLLADDPALTAIVARGIAVTCGSKALAVPLTGKDRA